MPGGGAESIVMAGESDVFAFADRDEDDERQEKSDPDDPLPSSMRCRICTAERAGKKSRYCLLHKRAYDCLYKDAQAQDKKLNTKTATQTFTRLMASDERAHVLFAVCWNLTP